MIEPPTSRLRAQRQRLQRLATTLLPNRDLPGLSPLDLPVLAREVVRRGEGTSVQTSVKFLVWICDLPPDVAPIGPMSLDELDLLEPSQRRAVTQWLAADEYRLFELGESVSRHYRETASKK